MTQKFYALTAEEIIELSSLLTDTELKIYLYLMAVNPFGDRLHEIDTALISEHLDVSRRTVQRVVKKLETLELIELEVSKFKYRRQQDRQATAGSPKRQQDRRNDSRIAETTAGSPKRQQDRRNDSRIAETTAGSPRGARTFTG